MRITIEGNVGPCEVIAEPFSIEGSEESFAVHQTLPRQVIEMEAKPFTATHVDTGFAIARGDTIDEAIAAAKEVWASKTPEQISAAIDRAKKEVFLRNVDLSGE